MSIIQYGEGNTSGVLTPLIPFNCIIDTDFGLLSLIGKSFLDTSYFSIDFFSKNSLIEELVKSLYYREEENPLSICMLEETKQFADTFYCDFIEQKYDEILKISMTTEVYNVIELYRLYWEIKPTIVYEKESEIELLNYLKVTKSVPKVKIDEIDFNFYNQFYFKSINDIYCKKFARFIETKMVYIANYKFNLDEENNIAENKNTVAMEINRDKFMLFDIYDRNNLE